MPLGTTLGPGEVQVSLPDGLTVDLGDYMRIKSLDGIWRCSGLRTSAQPFPPQEVFVPGFEEVGFDDRNWDEIPVPLDWYRHYPDTYDREKPYVRGFYRHSFELSPGELHGKRVLLHFGVIGYEAVLFVNGSQVGSHHGDFVPWTADVTDFLQPGTNLIALQVDSDFGPSRGNIKLGSRTYGSQWSPANIKGGVWQPVELRFVPEIHIERMLITPLFAEQAVELDYRILNPGGAKSLELCAAVTDAMRSNPNQLNSEAVNRISLKPGDNAGRIRLRLKDPVAWSPDCPQLYYASLMLKENDQVLSARTERFGFRQFIIRDGKFHLNGNRIYLFGENIPSVSFGGRGDEAACRKRLSEWLINFKRHGYNIIRPAHMPAIKELYEIADEIGLMIYDEWGWCFTNAIDEPEFSRRNSAELTEWMLDHHNHPCVVMYSGGNEVVHRNNPGIQRQLDKQYELIQTLDRSARPIGTFSGSGSWPAYGNERRRTDFLDLHLYAGNADTPWSRWPATFTTLYEGLAGAYPLQQKRYTMPYIIWECVGFSWGHTVDPDFRTGDIDRYLTYARKTSSWGQPNGIGYAGTIGLAEALKPGSMDRAKALYGHRLLELMRQDDRIDGFAPWFQSPHLKAATLWNQPILPGLRGSNGLPPRNLFSGGTVKVEGFVANHSGEDLSRADFRIVFQTAAGEPVPGGEFAAAPAAPFEISVCSLELPIPAGLDGHVQLRLQLFRDGREIGRNYYPVYIQSRDILAGNAGKRSGSAALIDCGDRRDVEAAARVMSDLGIDFSLIAASDLSPAFRLAVIPAAIHGREPLNIDKLALYTWLRDGGTLLVLEQNYRTGNLIDGVKVLSEGNTFIDLVYPAHPVFRGLDRRNFDTWDNPRSGYVSEGALDPFTENAVAVKGPLLGRRNVETAVLEATFGEGHLFWTQLAATALWGGDSSATRYLANVFDYLLSGERHQKILPLASVAGTDYEVSSERLDFIDLTRFMNRGFADDVAEDGQGGWTDQGDNDFRHMPLGRQVAAGIPFEIVDPATNAGNSCIILRGTQRPGFPDGVRNIPVKGRYNRLFFLNTAAWDGLQAGRYRIHYTDGAWVDHVLIPGVNIGDWWNHGYLPEARPGLFAPNPTRDQVATYVTVWENPHPDREIAAFDFLSASAPELREIDFNPGRTPVPILIAVTGEKSAEELPKINAPVRQSK